MRYARGYYADGARVDEARIHNATFAGNHPFIAELRGKALEQLTCSITRVLVQQLFKIPYGLLIGNAVTKLQAEELYEAEAVCSLLRS